MKLFRQWVASCEEQAKVKDPEIEEGIQKILDAEAFISKLDAEINEIGEQIEARWNAPEA